MGSTTNSDSNDRAAFEAWLLRVHEIDAAWNEARNCYEEFPAHMAFSAWQAARAEIELLKKRLGEVQHAWEVTDLELQRFKQPGDKIRLKL